MGCLDEIASQQVCFYNSSSKLLLDILRSFDLHGKDEIKQQQVLDTKANNKIGKFLRSRLGNVQLTAFNALKRAFITLSGFLEPMI